MKLSSKFIAVALALGFTTPVFAANIQAGINTSGSDLILNVYDATAQVSYTANLNILFPNFSETSTAANSDHTWNFGTDANWTAFLADVAQADPNYATNGDLLYNVVAWSDTNGTALADTLYTTAPVGTTAATLSPNERNSQLYTSTGIVDSYAQDINGSANFNQTLGTTVEVEQGSMDLAYFGNGFGANWDGQQATTSMAAVGTALDFFQVLTSSSNKLAKVTVTQFATAAGADTWDLSSTGTLTYSSPAVVPEPETYALLGLGLAAAALVRRAKKI